MVESEKNITANLDNIGWVVADEIRDENIVDSSDILTWRVIDELPLAYDTKADVSRYEELKLKYEEERAKRIILEEIEDDIAFHFLELGSDDNRVKLYEYEYKIGEDGRLRESAGEMDLVEKMFYEQENEVVGGLWMSHIIPFLEDAQVGQSVFTLSVKSEDIYEGLYDFSYMMIKTSEDTVKCMGIELDLSKGEERNIINRQLKENGAPEKVLLAEEFDWREGRGRAVMYEKHRYENLEEMFFDIVGKVLNESRSEYELGDELRIKEYLNEQRKKGKQVRSEVVGLVEEMVDELVAGNRVDELLQKAQTSCLIRNDYDLYSEGLEKGYVVLACGVVNLSKEGEGFYNKFDSEKNWDYHNGTCVRCKNSDVEVGPCEICKKCEVELESE